MNEQQLVLGTWGIKMNLSSLTAAAVAAAVVAAASVLAFSAIPGLFVWAAFMGWASYDHSGATPRAALRSSAALAFGVAMAWAVALVIAAGTLPLGVSLATAIAAGIASFLIVLASAAPILSVVPATFYGFASTFAYLSLVPGAFTMGALTALKWENVVVALPISLLIGTALGAGQGWLASVLMGGQAVAKRWALRLDGSSVDRPHRRKAYGINS